MKEEFKIFNDYVKQYDLRVPEIMRKFHHTYRVVNYAEYIAESLNLSSEEIKLAKICALLHDIARFYQWTKYQTYSDLNSIDHGDMGEKILKDGFIKKFNLDEKNENIVFDTVRLHNKFEVESINEYTDIFVKIIRDADRLDIIENIYFANKDKEIVIKDNLLNDIYNGKILLNKDTITDTDIVLKCISWINDFNYKSSFKYLKDNKILDKKIEALGEDFKVEKLKKYIDDKFKKEGCL